MKKFSVIPVIDILNGVAVRANKGNRDKYEPIQNHLCKTSSALELAQSFETQYHFEELYIADLDSIIYEKINLELLRKVLTNTSLKVIVDIGIRNMYDFYQIRDIGVSKIILATETIDSLNVISEAINEVGAENLIVSIDMKAKKLLARSEEVSKYSIFEIINQVNKMGITQIILLDLLKIGSKSGCYHDIYGKIREEYPDLFIIVGGGVRSINDLIFLKEKGINGALIASALHDKLILPEDLKKL
ncbi:MAG: HisA/HisF-related TIM barrel protein [Promethearchaeota archaeon]